MECRSPRTVASDVPQRLIRRTAALTAWLCGSLAVGAAAQSPASLFGEAAWGPVQLAAGSWCDVRLPSEIGPERELELRPPMHEPGELAVASHRGLAPSTISVALLDCSDESVACDSAELLRMAADVSVMGRDLGDSYSELKAAMRGTGVDAAAASPSEPRTAGYAPGSIASSSRTEPTIWAVVAIAVCGLGLAGLSAPLMTTRLTSPGRKVRL